MPGFDIATWYAIWAPPRTPSAIVARLQQAVAAAVAVPEVREKLATLGAEPVADTPERIRHVLRQGIRPLGKARARRARDARLMRALVCESWREFDALEVKDIPPPPMRPGGVRIRVEAVRRQLRHPAGGRRQVPAQAAAALHPGDRDRRDGDRNRRPTSPNPLPPGTRVFAVLDWGGLAEEAVADAIHVVPIPDGLPLDAAVAMPISYPTAGSALMWRARLEPGQWVLVHGAAAGVGLAGVEIAKALGARVIARCGAAKRQVPGARGADLVLDSALPFRDAVREATGGAGVAAVLDTLGGPVFDDNLRCLGDGGMLVTIGFAAGGIPTLPINLLLLKNIAVAGLNWGTYVGWSPGDNRHLHAPRARALWQQLVDWWAAGKLHPEVHASFPLGTIPRGHGRGARPAMRWAGWCCGRARPSLPA